MIIQTGMRTDIPAFYSQWLLNRIKEGFVLVRNPYHKEQVTRYSLSPEVVDLIAFCTKNPAPMLPHMDPLAPYGQYWFVTITPYGREIEPNVPDREQVIGDFQKLSRTVGVDSVGWRYDPIFLDATHSVDWHIAEFQKMAQALAGYTRTWLTIGKAFVEIAKENGMIIRPCAEGDELAPYGADCSGCMTVDTFETALHAHLDVPKRKTNQRNGDCACLLGVDIGAYDTCGHLCRYCYANANAALVRDNMKKHDPESPFLLGTATPQDVIHEAKQKSWLDRQIRMEIV
jgi:hypothetical protein